MEKFEKKLRTGLITSCVLFSVSNYFGVFCTLSLVVCAMFVGLVANIIMNETVIGEGCNIEKSIIAEKVNIGNNVVLGAFQEKENETKPGIYCEGLCTIGEKSVIPDNVTIGKNTMISGETTAEDYPNGILESGRTLDKAGD